MDRGDDSYSFRLQVAPRFTAGDFRRRTAPSARPSTSTSRMSAPQPRPPECSSAYELLQSRLLTQPVLFMCGFFLAAGCQRVPGDEEEDGVDNLENEFNWDGHDSQSVADSMLYSHMSYGRGGDANGTPQTFQLNPNAPLLTNGQMVDNIPPEQHALVPSFMGSGGKRIRPLPYADPSLPVQPRSMDPSKDLGAYGYGSVA